ncbi:MAG: hypothetical protein WAN46_12715 [Gammaproteobacteria bacterium]|jgi:hypothetical protein
MKKMTGLFAAALLVMLSAIPLHSAQAQPWGFNMFGMSVGQNWGYPGWGGPWGYPGWRRGWGYPYHGYRPWGYPGWGGPWGVPQRPVIIIQPVSPKS